MKNYVTFGQSHRHEIGGVVFDKDCVAIFESSTDGYKKALALFGAKFCFHYDENMWVPEMISHFPRGLVQVPLDAREEKND